MMRLGGGQRRVGGSYCNGESKRRHQSGENRRFYQSGHSGMYSLKK